MFGSKLRSWMEAVRPRKKQHRKEKQNKNKNANQNPTEIKNVLPPTKVGTTKIFGKKNVSEYLTSKTPMTQSSSNRYSAANLSSPESAYSTGYSTDGTSPGAPPDYYGEVKARLEGKPPIKEVSPPVNKSVTNGLPKSPIISTEINRPIVNSQPLVEVASPRQRNRIRTNPWVPSTTNNKVWSNNRQGFVEVGYSNAIIHYGACSPRPTKKSVSSSSCYSLSGAESYWEASEEDYTLNEVMGKYDESYVYEKETDILSDSEPTDFDTDFDTGQDGGDELEPQENDLYYIDDGSYTESGTGENKNTGHCSYFHFQSQRKSSKKQTHKKSRHRSSSNKKRMVVNKEHNLPRIERNDGFRSVGATPLLCRRTRQLPLSKLVLEDKLKKRSNSTHLYQNISSIDRKDKEADKKYKELIVEAEHILRNIKTEGSSPRRLPGPANKRVEVLRNTECPNKVRLGDVPSTSATKSPRLSTRTPQPTRSINKKHPDIQSTRSPKHKRKTCKARVEIHSSSSEDEQQRLKVPPQSEPVRRKVYSSGAKNVAFHPNCNSPVQIRRKSVDSLRHQVLINTIQNLKRNLENQSASLKEVYRSSQNIPCWLD